MGNAEDRIRALEGAMYMVGGKDLVDRVSSIADLVVPNMDKSPSVAEDFDKYNGWIVRNRTGEWGSWIHYKVLAGDAFYWDAEDSMWCLFGHVTELAELGELHMVTPTVSKGLYDMEPDWVYNCFGWVLWRRWCGHNIIVRNVVGETFVASAEFKDSLNGKACTIQRPCTDEEKGN